METQVLPQSKQYKLTREQKEAIGLLSMGTWLEYFDLMLYVHMAVLLNDLFFPKTDAHSTALLTAFAFCSTYLLRPFGALIFGWIGDNIGRKATVVITSFLMAISCIVMAVSPTFHEVGISASITITICRIAQGLSSMGEKIGAEIYLTETFKPPLQYSVVASIPTFSAIGTISALFVASVMTSRGFNWRYAFAIGAVISVIGFVARATLRETVEFADAKRRAIRTMEKIHEDPRGLENNPILHEAINKKTALALFLMQCTHPIWLYVTYIYSSHILKSSFGFSSADIIHRNLIIAIVDLFVCIALTYLSYRIYPLKILKFVLKITFIGMICAAFFLNYITPSLLLCFQLFISIFAPSTMPATPIFLKYFPVFKRFTSATLLYAVSRAVMYFVTSFGLVYLVEYFNYIGILMLVIPALIGYWWGLNHFEKLETKAGNYPQKNRLVHDSVVSA